jgi:hypothetical protein
VNDHVRFPNKFTETLLKNPSENTASVIWGGASKGVIFALLKERHDQPVNMVIDINPAKQGKFLAATGLQVVSPSQAMAKMPAGSTLYIMNSNYTKEIQRMSNNTFRYVAIDQ